MGFWLLRMRCVKTCFVTIMFATVCPTMWNGASSIVETEKWAADSFIRRVGAFGEPIMYALCNCAPELAETIHHSVIATSPTGSRRSKD